MKTTIDLPDKLLRQLKLRAVKDGRKLKDLAEELLREGLAKPRAPKKRSQAVVATDKETGLPVIQCRHAALANGDSPEKIAEILSNQEVEWYRESA